MPRHPDRTGHRTPRRTGRPTKCTPAVTKVIIDHHRQGVPFEAAAEAAGVHPSTAWRWLADGENPAADRRYREFYEAIRRARAEAEANMVGAVVAAAKGGAVIRHSHRVWRNGTEEDEYQYAPPDGKVALEFLARRYPDRWARRQADQGDDQAVAAVPGGPQVVIIAALADRLHQHLTDEGRTVIAGELMAADENHAAAS